MQLAGPVEVDDDAAAVAAPAAGPHTSGLTSPDPAPVTSRTGPAAGGPTTSRPAPTRSAPTPTPHLSLSGGGSRGLAPHTLRQVPPRPRHLLATATAPAPGRGGGPPPLPTSMEAPGSVRG